MSLHAATAVRPDTASNVAAGRISSIALFGVITCPDPLPAIF